MTVEMIGPHSAFESGVWRSRDGQLWAIHYITDAHLANLIPYCKGWLALHNTFCTSDDRACTCNELDSAIHQNMTKWLHLFELESKRRFESL